MALVLALLLGQFAFADRTAEIVDLFSKTKQKQKRGVSRYLQVTAEPMVRSSNSGTYEAKDFAYALTIVTNGDTATGHGHDTAKFTLRDARLRGAHLTATKVYANGTTAPLEGLFLRRTIREGTSPDDARVTHTDIGLGIVGVDFDLGGIHVDRLFYEARPVVDSR